MKKSFLTIMLIMFCVVCVALGLVKYTKIGGRNIYSRHQLNCLREAERENSRLVFRKIQPK